MAYAPLGRLIRRHEQDVRRAENHLILVITALLMVLMFANQIAWAFVKDPILAEPEGPVAMVFWLSQLGFLLGFILGCVIGFKPALTITCGAQAVHIQEESTETVIPYNEIELVRTITSLTFHRHFRKYRQTRVFVNLIEDELILLETTRGPVILGIAPEDHPLFIKHVERQRVMAPTLVKLKPAQVA